LNTNHSSIIVLPWLQTPAYWSTTWPFDATKYLKRLSVRYVQRIHIYFAFRLIQRVILFHTKW